MAGCKGEVRAEECSGRCEGKGGLDISLIGQADLVRMCRAHKHILHVQSVEGEDALWTQAVTLDLERQARLPARDITVGHSGEGGGCVGVEYHRDLGLGVGPNLTLLQLSTNTQGYTQASSNSVPS